MVTYGRRVVCRMMWIWKGIILFSSFVAVSGEKGDVSFTPGKPWDEYTGNLYRHYISRK
jgi:hypothetical protein